MNTDPQLGPLAANGGSTGSCAPLAGSPAIDAGDNSGCPASDQRGYPRPIGSAPATSGPSSAAAPCG